MRVLVILMAVGILAQQQACKEVRVTGEPTADCPAGVWLVTYDRDKNEVSRRCETPPGSPSPSTAPSTPPSIPPTTTTTTSTTVPTTTTTSTTSTTTTTTTLPPGSGCGTCPDPVDMKIGISATARKLQLGYRNTGSGTPSTVGDCCHKNDPRPEAVCAVNEGCADHCGSPYHVRFGQPQMYQSGNGFQKHPVERTTDGCTTCGGDPSQPPCGYNVAFSTNHPADWSGGRFRYAGAMRVCASMPNLDFWGCRDGSMSGEGKMEGFVGAPIIRVPKTAAEREGRTIPKGIPMLPRSMTRQGAKGVKSPYSGYRDER